MQANMHMTENDLEWSLEKIPYSEQGKKERRLYEFYGFWCFTWGLGLGYLSQQRGC
jgi:hypothetical protein